MNADLWDRLWKAMPFLVYKTNQKDETLSQQMQEKSW